MRSRRESSPKIAPRGIVRGRGASRPGRRHAAVRLVWDGKPDASELASGHPPADPVDFRCVERQFPPGASPPWRHRLFRGENKDVLWFIRAEFAASIDLVYIDPPFDIGLDFGLRLAPGGEFEMQTPAFSDRWSDGVGSHAHMMWERLRLIRPLLTPSGCIFLHCDWRSSAVMRLLLDEVFGAGCFRNEIIWRRAPNLGRQAASNQLGRVAESILVYSAKPGTPFLGTPPTRSIQVPLDALGRPRRARWDEQAQSFFTTAPRGDYTDRSIARLRAQGRIHDTPSGKVYVKYFLRRGDDGLWYKDQPVDTIWDDPDVRPLRHCSRDELAVGYATQKPEGLLRRIISWASPPGGLVADFFCGSGTTGVVAQQLGRRWIMADASPVALRIARSRLLARQRSPGSPSESTAFDVLHPDEPGAARWWRAACGEDVERHRRLVLEAFGARQVEPSDCWVHGIADDEAVHVLPPDARLDVARVAAAADAASRRGLRRLCCLASMFDPSLHCPERTVRAVGGVQVRAVPVPDRPLESGENGCDRWPGLPEVELRVEAEGRDRVRVELLSFGWLHGRSSETDGLAELVEWWGVELASESPGPFAPAWQDQRNPRRRCVERVAIVADAGGEAERVRVAVMDAAGRFWTFERAVARTVPIPTVARLSPGA